MRRFYKSFMLNKAAKVSIGKSKSDVTPKMSIKQNPKSNDATITISHYDNNQPISLSLPESLCFEGKSHDVEIQNYKKPQHASSQSKKYDHIEEAVILSESHSEHIEPYSDANSYFDLEEEQEEENQHNGTANKAYVVSKSEEVNLEDQNSDEQAAVQDSISNNEQANELPELNEADRIADKKFEEDLRSILNQKKSSDKKRVQENPSEATKNKDHGVANDSDKEFKKKLEDRHAIFDQIAQSMKMADTYDFGAIAMNKKLDDLEEETNEDFTQKIQDVIEEVDQEKQTKPSYSGGAKEDDKVLTEDFLDDINKLNEMSSPQSKKQTDYAEDAIVLEDNTEALKDAPINKVHEKEPNDTSKKMVLSEQSSFNSTISIKHRYLKSRVFNAPNGSITLAVDSGWVPEGCSDISNINVTLTQEINWGIDNEIGTKPFRIGTLDTKTWSNVPSGNYYLTFFFVNNTNPNCELKGTINVTT